MNIPREPASVLSLVRADQFGFGVHGRPRGFPDLRNRALGLQVQPVEAKSCDTKMIVMQAMPFGRFRTVITRMAEVVPRLHHRAGLGPGGSFRNIGLACWNVVHAPMPKGARGRIRILDDHDVAPCVSGSASPA